MKRRPALLAFALGAALWLCALPAAAERMSYLDNGVIRLGVDLDLGGVITYLSKSGRAENVINSHDYGRQIQQSYYSGPQPFGHPHPSWPDWPWNPIGTGDVYGHPAQVIGHSNNARTLYVKSIPMQWALDNVPGDCTFETWITLKGSAALVRCRLSNHRLDKTQYHAYDQELPAVYTIGKLYRLFTYDGLAPYTDRPVREVGAGFPWTAWKATEHWAALVNDAGWGLGVFHAVNVPFIGGFFGTRNVGGPHDDPTGYIAPVGREILDHNIVYDYHYALILGTIREIRAFAVANRVRDTRPNYRFTAHRQRWWYINASDKGWPIRGAVRVQLEQNDPQMIGPEQWWAAKDVPKLYLRAAFHTKQDYAEVFWSVPGQGFAAERRVGFRVIPDGRVHTYEVNLAANTLYRDTITGIRFDPVPSGTPGEYADIASISWKRP